MFEVSHKMSVSLKLHNVAVFVSWGHNLERRGKVENLSARNKWVHYWTVHGFGRIVALVKEESHQWSIGQFSGAPGAEGIYWFNHVLLGQGLLHLLFGSNGLNGVWLSFSSIVSFISRLQDMWGTWLFLSSLGLCRRDTGPSFPVFCWHL